MWSVSDCSAYKAGIEAISSEPPSSFDVAAVVLWYLLCYKMKGNHLISALKIRGKVSSCVAVLEAHFPISINVFEIQLSTGY